MSRQRVKYEICPECESSVPIVDGKLAPHKTRNKASNWEPVFCETDDEGEYDDSFDSFLDGHDTL